MRFPPHTEMLREAITEGALCLASRARRKVADDGSRHRRAFPYTHTMNATSFGSLPEASDDLHAALYPSPLNSCRYRSRVLGVEGEFGASFSHDQPAWMSKSYRYPSFWS